MWYTAPLPPRFPKRYTSVIELTSRHTQDRQFHIIGIIIQLHSVNAGACDSETNRTAEP